MEDILGRDINLLVGRQIVNAFLRSLDLRPYRA